MLDQVCVYDGVKEEGVDAVVKVGVHIVVGPGELVSVARLQNRGG